MASDSALIVILPGDSVDTVIRKVRDAGAGSVQLLVPDGTPALQALSGFAQVCRSLDRDHIDLLVISSDEKTLNAARLNQVETLGVEGAHVTVPAPGESGRANAYTTRTLRADDLDHAGAPIADQDAEFLDALDQVSAQDRYAGLSDDDAEMFSALDDLSDAIQGGSPTRRRRDDDELAAALDDLDQSPGADRATHGAGEDWESAFGGEGVARRRVRPEDIDLADDDIRRQRGGRRTEALRERARARDTAPILGRRTQRIARDDRLLDLEEAEEQKPQRRGMLAFLLVLLILVLLGVIALWWYNRNSVALTVAPPTNSVSTTPFSGEVIPLTDKPAAGSAAVQAAPADADAEYIAEGQVISETLAPAGTAKGVITIYNELPQTIDLPGGTELVATNGQGQEVRFVLDVPATIPAAVSSSSVAGSSTTNGKIDVAVTARSPGSASNVDENAIKQILIPGQQPIVSDSSNFLIRHGPIGGGSEQPQRIVTNEDVQRVLGDALTGLYNAGVQALRSKIDEKKQGIEPDSISPDPQTLAKPDSYEPPVVNPPVGQPVDPNDPKFTVMVKTHFNGLAAPVDHPISQQLQTVVGNLLQQRGSLPCKPGETPGFNVASWKWDANRLTAGGTITCTPSGGVGPEVTRRVQDAVRGRSYADAEAALQELKRQGLIGDYTLPERDSFPKFDPLINVTIAQPAQPTPGTP